MIHIITANQRQANVLKQQKKFAKALVFTWSEWLQFCWKNLEADIPQESRLASSIELQYIWHQAVAKVLDNSNHDIETLAQLASNAYQLLIDYQIPIASLGNFDHGNTKWLARVFEEVKKQCNALKLITPQSLTLQLMQHTTWLAAKTKTILFYHFIDFSPLQKKCFNVLQQNGIEIKFENLAVDTRHQATFKKYHEPQNEIDAAIQELIAAHQENPQQSLALIVPDLANWQSHIEFKLKETLFPYELNPNTLPWHFSLQPRLTETSIICTALKLINLTYQNSINLSELIVLLRSPYWLIGTFDSRITSAFMLSCQNLACQEFDWYTLTELAKPFAELETLLLSWQQQRTNKKQTFSTWLCDWQQLLIDLGFATSINLTAAESSILQQWQKMLAELNETLAWLPPISALEAYKILQRYCQQVRCSITSEHQPPIQILGVLEALGESYDQAWLTGANSSKFPTAYNINPVLPIILQKKYDIPAVNHAIQEKLAQQCYAILTASLPQLTISFAQSAEEMPLQPASFCPHDIAVCEDVVAHQVTAHTKLNTPSDSGYPDLRPWSAQKALPGGSSALKAQQQCSIQAFARHRLNLAALPEPTLGLTFVERGNIAHRALQLAWQHLKEQKDLFLIDDEGLHNLVQRIARIALRSVAWQRRKLLPQAVVHLEIERQTQLLKKWLLLEKTRAPFKIYALEKDLTVSFADQKWRLRVDRIDELADGHLLLIDYKTGLTTTNAWRLDYFNEPQLPLYCVSSGLEFAGLAFAEYSQTSMKFKGIAKTAIDLGDFGNLEVVHDWQTLQQGWHDLLTKLTYQFVNSDARVAPNERLHSCQYCDLASFCRIYQRSDAEV